MQKTKIGLRGLNAKQKVNKAKQIESAMERSSHFRDSRRAHRMLGELAASRKSLEKAIDLAAYGDKRALAARDLCEKNLDDKIRRLAGLVDVESGGDAAAIRSAGFELRKRNNRPRPMTAPQSLTLKRTERSGEIALRWKPVPNSRNYFIELMRAEKPTGSWKTKTYSTKSGCLIDGLTPGGKYRVRVRAIGARGVGPPSEVLEFIAT